MLVVGAILAPGKRTVSAILRTMGLQGERKYAQYHQGLNRAVWSSRAMSEILLEAVREVKELEGWQPATGPNGVP